MNSSVLLGLIVGLSIWCRPTTAQGGSVTYFGTPCSTNSVTPPADQRVVGSPRLGQTLVLRYLGGNLISPCDAIGCMQQPVVVVGLSNTRFGNLNLPYRPPGRCSFRVSGEVVLPMPPVTMTRFRDSLTVQVPTDSRLIGSSIYVQWLTVDSGAFLASSPGAHITIGR